MTENQLGCGIDVMGTGMEKWQIETAERLASIERSIKYIETNLNALPQSSQCERDFERHHQRITALEEFKGEIAKRIAWVSGAFAAIAASIPYAIEFVRASFKG